MKKVQIVLPCINLWEKYTRPAIDSIQAAMMRAKTHGVDCRLLLIDNGSTDGTRAAASKYVSELFAHQRNEERWGFQKSVNFGVNDAWERGFDYVLVCNNDILLHPEAIWRLVERFENPFFLRTTDDKGEPVPMVDVPLAMVTCMDMRGEIEPGALSQYNAKDKEACADSPHPNFSAFMLSRECWDTVGEMDEAFAPAYFEDNDYHYRIQLSGMEAITHAPALFFHFASGTQREANGDGSSLVSHGMFENNKATYVRKWGGMPGHETFKTPYDNPEAGISDVAQCA